MDENPDTDRFVSENFEGRVVQEEETEDENLIGMLESVTPDTPGSIELLMESYLPIDDRGEDKDQGTSDECEKVIDKR